MALGCHQYWVHYWIYLIYIPLSIIHTDSYIFLIINPNPILFFITISCDHSLLPKKYSPHLSPQPSPIKCHCFFSPSPCRPGRRPSGKESRRSEWSEWEISMLEQSPGLSPWWTHDHEMTIWVWVNTYRYIFSGMNIHLPAILGFTRYQGFDPSPYDPLVN